MNSTRLQLAKTQPEVVEQYGVQTRDAVEALADQLKQMFVAQQTGRVGRRWAARIEPLFALWCEQSGVVVPDKARELVAGSSPTVPDLVRVLRTDLGFPRDLSRDAAEEFVSRIRSGEDPSLAEDRLVRRLYDGHVRALCIQSAHVTLARLVFYRVLEDQGLARERVSGPPLEDTISASAKGLVGAPPAPAFQLMVDICRESEDFMPLLYERRELDWWLLDPPLTARQREEWSRLLAPVDVELQRTLALLDGFDFSAVDRDVWKDVYQHHLPWEERQRLGGFYTPDALVELTLDLADWREGNAELAEQSLIDISCGSGTFLVEALRRRRGTMEKAGKLGPSPAPEELDELLGGIVGLDIHPFATFLASTNLVFQVIDLYMRVRRRHPEYQLPLDVFTVDSLEERGLHPRQAALQEEIPEDIRIHHTEREIARYREIARRRFNAVVGNPPWGGVLKGRLSPLFDPEKRERYRTSGRYRSATDKFDIYTLFIERCLQLTTDGGRYALVTPNTYRDKDFGAGIRAVLADTAPPHTIVDLGPFGSVLFKAMNTPSVTAGTRPPSYEELTVVAVGRRFPFAARGREPRQRELIGAVDDALDGGAPARVVRFEEPVSEVQGWGGRPWRLHPLWRFREPLEKAGDESIGTLFEPLQGVTPGGEGMLKVFQMPLEQSRALGLEDELVHSALKGTDIGRWSVTEAETVMLYPYQRSDRAEPYQPAFALPGERDALEPHPYSREEERLVAGLREDEARERLLTHRTAIGQCKFPNAGRHLL